jgi:hypothetical protein
MATIFPTLMEKCLIRDVIQSHGIFKLSFNEALHISAGFFFGCNLLSHEPNLSSRYRFLKMYNCNSSMSSMNSFTKLSQPNKLVMYPIFLLQQANLPAVSICNSMRSSIQSSDESDRKQSHILLILSELSSVSRWYKE